MTGKVISAILAINLNCAEAINLCKLWRQRNRFINTGWQVNKIWYVSKESVGGIER